MIRPIALILWGGLLVTALTALVSTAMQAEDLASPIAPTGKLRAAINLGNRNLAAKDPQTGELRGLAVDLSYSFAGKLGLPVMFVEYKNVGAIIDNVRNDGWDIAFLAVDPARNGVDFSPSYMEVEAGFLVPTASSILAAADIDRPGIRVAVPGRSAGDLFLSRSLKHATLVRGDSERAAFDALVAGRADVLATSRSSFQVFIAGTSAYRELPELLLAVPHSIAVPEGRSEALAAVAAFVEEAKASGEIARAISRTNLTGLRVAPAAPGK